MDNRSAQTKNILPFNSNNTTKAKTKAQKAPIDEGKGVRTRRRVLMTGKARRRTRRVSTMGKARKREGGQGAQFSRRLSLWSAERKKS